MARRLALRTLLAAWQLPHVSGDERHRAVRLRSPDAEAAADRADPEAGTVTPRRSPWWVILVVALIVATLGITAAATLLSFLAFQSLAELVGWDPATAWLVQPVVELFVLAGAAELAMRTWERREDRSLPEVLMYTALVVSIAVNVSSHVLANVDARALWWHTAVIGVLAAFVPLAQVGGVFLLTDRLRALGDRRAVGEVVREEVTSADGSGGFVPAPGPSAPGIGDLMPTEIGRASCRERV